MPESDIVHLLARMFPSFRGVPADEALRRAEALGQFSFKAWTAGAAAMQARGIPVAPDVHAKLAPLAAQAAQAERGGVIFLARLRQGVGDDTRFVQVMTGLARVYAEVLRAQPPAAPARPPAAPARPPAAAAQPPAAAAQPPAAAAQPPAAAAQPPAAAAQPPAAAAQPPAAQPPASALGDGPLELAPERPAPARSFPGAGDALDLVQGDPSPASAAAPIPASGDSGELQLASDSGDRMRNSMEMLYGEEDDVAAVEHDEGAPQDPAEKAFWCFERTGASRFLQQADAALRADLQKAPHATAAAVAEANLGKVALLSGDGEGAQRLANSALARDPSNPYAVEVLVRAQRGEADEAAFRQGLRQLSSALNRRELDSITKLGQAMSQRYPVEPFGHLGLAFAAKLADKATAFDRYLKDAWTSYPSVDHADCNFGGEFDADLAEVLITYGRHPYKKMDEDGLRQTVENVDSKDNLIAGSLRMGVGLARVALTVPGISRAQQRRLHYSVGRGMMGLQYFQAAPDVMGKAMMIGPTPEEAKAISNERIQCQALWRAFDKPGIKAQGQAFKCVGAHGMAETLRRRLETIRQDRDERQQSLNAKVPMLLERAEQDPSIAQELAAAADARSLANPLDAILAIDSELTEIERAASTPAETPKSKGLFGKLKAAAVDAAKGVSDRIKIPQLKARRGDAIKNLAVVIARDLSDWQFTSPVLIGFVRQAAVMEAFVDYLESEESRCKKELAQLAGS